MAGLVARLRINKQLVIITVNKPCQDKTILKNFQLKSDIRELHKKDCPGFEDVQDVFLYSSTFS